MNMEKLIIGGLIVMIVFLVWGFVRPAIVVVTDLANGLRRIFGKKPS